MYIKTWLAIQIENSPYIFHMENQFLNRVTHLFPSSCQFPSASDIIQTTSISPLNSNTKNRTKQQQSSSKGEWFSSEEEEDSQFYGKNRASFSLSSNGSLESFRRNLACSRRKKCKSRRRSCGSHLDRCSFEIPAHSRDIPQDFGESTGARRKKTKFRRRADMGRRKTSKNIFVLFYYYFFYSEFKV